MQKYRKNNLEMIALTLLKAAFEFLNMFVFILKQRICWLFFAEVHLA